MDYKTQTIKLQSQVDTLLKVHETHKLNLSKLKPLIEKLLPIVNQVNKSFIIKLFPKFSLILAELISLLTLILSFNPPALDEA